jgi:hypothetical protein
MSHRDKKHQKTQFSIVIIEFDSPKGTCVHCGKPTSSPNVEYCKNCFLMELKTRVPQIKFLRADHTETEVPEECVYIQGIQFKRRKK